MGAVSQSMMTYPLTFQITDEKSFRVSDWLTVSIQNQEKENT